MENMMGKCEYCGAEIGVMAETQAEANKIAEKQCDCSGARIAGRKQSMKEELNKIIGKKAPESDFAPVDEMLYQVIEEIGVIIVDGLIRQATFKVDGTIITITATSEKIKVKRKRIYECEGEIQ